MFWNWHFCCGNFLVSCDSWLQRIRLRHAQNDGSTGTGQFDRLRRRALSSFWAKLPAISPRCRCKSNNGINCTAPQVASWPDVAAAAVAFAAADYAMGKVQQQLVWREMRICYTNKSLADYKLLQMRQSNGVAVMSCLHCSFRPLPAAFCHPIPTSQH